MDEVVAEGYSLISLYIASKILTKQSAWKFAAQRENFDLTTFLPTSLFGPYAPHFTLPHPDIMTSSLYIYTILNEQVPPSFMPNYMDIRDAAKAHIQALELASVYCNFGANVKLDDVILKLQDKRILVNAGVYTWAQAVEYLYKSYPDLRDKLPVIPKEQFNITGAKSAGKPLIKFAKCDNTHAKELLGITQWIKWKESMSGMVD
ncbi:hypothetical protein AX16_001274 [Volvariella volvacea WC 439]|nr:hypothetical protein AX16_001274 [Volvariella volvacea WC 439]